MCMMCRSPAKARITGSAELGWRPGPLAPAEAADLPDWLWEQFGQDLGAEAPGVAEALQARAPVFLRVNLARASRAEALARLASEGILCAASASVATALVVQEGARRIEASAAYRDGVVELQDASSQAAVLRLGLRDGMRVLDFCAGGGGKSLAMGALARLELVAHDVDQGRMRDLPLRAARAGLAVRRVTGAALTREAPADLVLVDAPCSGSGTWRRTPDAKWRLRPADLARLVALQAEILTQAARFVAPGGTLAYATCSVLAAENRQQATRFVASHPQWRLIDDWQALPGPEGDGFYLAQFSR
jgi:16S rRNA (cytosine967-C5)-methyltransferase